ncbi:hypothetical protein [Acetivibrio saccincola]|jgi:hypothetical protein|uniref:Uncharacterized protein n=1 Tax=Acetivibrio saccincola TaxID=1677857 RepID=A0A2K9DYG5_9FIRM|nr:hypothetical protein [Acetivibrio saccincola]AUG56567.1 hypothetical protein HVS_03085 [Acetivibrio saccincola]NLI57650.1 hypothetical protein [Clostridium sp.]
MSELFLTHKYFDFDYLIGYTIIDFENFLVFYLCEKKIATKRRKYVENKNII